jgi:hypothetical protein
MVDDVRHQHNLTGSALDVDEVEPALRQLDVSLLDAGHVLDVEPARAMSDANVEPSHSRVNGVRPHHDIGKTTDRSAVLGPDRTSDQTGHRDECLG